MSEHSPATLKLPVDIEGIQQLLIHRYPFLLVDRVTEFEAGQRIVVLKNVTINEPFFQGHFPKHPVMPGVLIIEALAQSAALLAQLTAMVREEPKITAFYLAKVEKARFNAMVTPGDQLRMEVTVKRLIRRVGLFTAVVTVDGKEVSSCELMCAGPSREEA